MLWPTTTGTGTGTGTATTSAASMTTDAHSAIITAGSAIHQQDLSATGEAVAVAIFLAEP
jgi:hypothetical protein